MQIQEKYIKLKKIAKLFKFQEKSKKEIVKIKT